MARSSLYVVSDGSDHLYATVYDARILPCVVLFALLRGEADVYVDNSFYEPANGPASWRVSTEGEQRIAIWARLDADDARRRAQFISERFLRGLERAAKELPVTPFGIER